MEQRLKTQMPRLLVRALSSGGSRATIFFLALVKNK